MPVCPLILSPPIVLRALRGDPALLVRAGGGQRRRALRALPALFSSVARVWSIGAFDQMRCAIDQFVISAAFYQLRNS